MSTIITEVAANILRDQHRVLASDGNWYTTTLLEMTRTNTDPNPRLNGAAVGTLPTTWTTTGNTNIVGTAVGVGTEDGLSYVDVRFAGSTTATTPLRIRFGTAATASNAGIADGQTWVSSAYVRMVGGSTAGLSYAVLRIAGSGDVITGEDFLPVISRPSLAQARRFAVGVTSGGTTNARGEIIFDPVSGAAIDITVRIAGTQLERGPAASSLILPPVGTQAHSTRAAETASYAIPPQMQPPAIVAAGGAAWYCEFVEGGTILTGTNTRLWQLGSGVISETPRLRVFSVVAGSYRAEHNGGGSGSVVTTPVELPTLSLGDRVQLLMLLYPDGSLVLMQRHNGGTVTATTRTAANVIQPWAGNLLHVNGVAGNSVGRIMVIPSGIVDANGKRQLITFLPGLPAMGLTNGQAMTYAAKVHAYAIPEAA